MPGLLRVFSFRVRLHFYTKIDTYLSFLLSLSPFFSPSVIDTIHVFPGRTMIKRMAMILSYDAGCVMIPRGSRVDPSSRLLQYHWRLCHFFLVILGLRLVRWGFLDTPFPRPSSLRNGELTPEIRFKEAAGPCPYWRC